MHICFPHQISFECFNFNRKMSICICHLHQSVPNFTSVEMDWSISSLFIQEHLIHASPLSNTILMSKLENFKILRMLNSKTSKNSKFQKILISGSCYQNLILRQDISQWNLSIKKFINSKISRFLKFTISEFPKIKTSKFQKIKVASFQNFKTFLNFKILKFKNFKLSKL